MDSGRMKQDLLFGELHPGEMAYYAEVAAHKGWHTAADAAMQHLADTGLEFTAADLRQLLEDAPHPGNMNAYGGLFTAWAKRGHIERVGYQPSTQQGRNGGIVSVWKGTNRSTHHSR